MKILWLKAFGLESRINGRYINESIILECHAGKSVGGFYSQSAWCVEFWAVLGNSCLQAP